MKTLLRLICVLVVLTGCNGGGGDSENSIPLDGVDGEVIVDGEITIDGDGVGDSSTPDINDNSTHQNLADTDFAETLYLVKNLCSINSQLTPIGLTEVHPYSYSLADNDGHREGVVIDLLLFEDFNYKLRVKTANHIVKDGGSTSYWKADNFRTVIDGEWFAHFNSRISLDIGLGASQFKLNTRDVVEISFPEEPIEGLEDLAGEVIWLSHTIVEKAFDEDLTCP